MSIYYYWQLYSWIIKYTVDLIRVEYRRHFKGILPNIMNAEHIKQTL